MSNPISVRLEAIAARIRAAAAACGRQAESVRLVAVAKTHPPEAIRLAAAAGAQEIGENYIQEARDKYAALQPLPLRWHFIGRLQTNKARTAVRIFELIHTVDSLKLGLELDRCAGRIAKRQKVLVQVNVAGEAAKSGVAPEEALPLVRELSRLEHIAVKGLMTMPPFFNDPERVRPFFSALRQLRDRIADAAPAGVEMRELSMGMTGDFEAAIAEGATLVRIGTAIFGERA
jgi:pyridoxal phosphate enzyme (YggS family)